MPRANHSTASGAPDHLAAGGITGVGAAYLPPPPADQRPPHYAGVELPLDPMLAAAGAYWNANRELVRAWRIDAGPAELVHNAAGVVIKRIQKKWTRERHVAPPGMTLEDARTRGLDFYSPQRGWIRAGVKPETDLPENLGMGHLVGEIEIIETTFDGSPLPESVPA